MLCRIGEVEVWRILELHGPFLPPEELFPNAGPDVARLIEACAPGNICAASGMLVIPIQGFLLKTPSAIILVDACVGNDKTNKGRAEWHRRADGRFLAGLTAAGVGPGDVDYVLCTHLHSDHVGWNTRLEDGRWVPTFPKARYVLPKADEAHYRALGADLYRESVLPVIEAGQAEMVDAGHALGDHVSLYPTPGHTPGHVSVRIHSQGEEAVITGDALHCSAQCLYPDWHFKYDEDAVRAVASRRRLLEMASDTGCTVLGTHFRLPSIGRVRDAGESFRWEAQ